MLTIHKFPLMVADGWQELKFPSGARPLHLAEQPPGAGETLTAAGPDGRLRAWLMLWAEVNPAHDLETFRFVIVGTGQPIPRTPTGRRPWHVGTVVTASGTLVWHVYAEPTAL